MFRILILIFFAASPYFATAQDYAITSRGDTLKGEVKVLTYDIYDRVEVSYKESGKKKTALRAIDVREVSLEGKIYHPAKTVDGYRMIQLKTKGSYLSLYLGHPPKGNSFDVPCLVKKDGGYLEVPGFSFKRLMAAFLSDCSAVKVDIETNVLTRKDLDQIIEKFNKCIDDATVVAKSGASTVTLSKDDPKVVAINNLIGRLEKDDNLKNGKDALDISRDILQKIKQGQDVPRYLTDGLKNALQNESGYQEDVNALVDLIQKK